MAPDREPPKRPPLPARLLGVGARGAERVAQATGIDEAVERTTEEAIVRALESPAVERAIIRVLESDEAQRAFERTLESPAVERAAERVLDSELVDHVWERLLASDEAQKLVERIAEAPEVRAAITQQGVGMIADLGRSIRELGDRVDAFIGRNLRRMRGLPPAPPVTQVGLFVRAIAIALDAAAVNVSLLAISAIFGITIAGVLGDDRNPSGGEILAGTGVWIMASATYLGVCWSAAGQTPGMRLLSIRLEGRRGRRIGAAAATRRVIGTALSVASLGIGFLIAAFDDRRRTLADRLAGTVVIEDDRASLRAPGIAPHSPRGGGRGAAASIVGDDRPARSTSRQGR